MKKLIIEITDDVLEDGDLAAINAMAHNSSLYLEFGRPHSNTDLNELAIAECFAIDIAQFSVRIEEL